MPLLNPDQTAPQGAVWSGFIVFASMVKLLWSAFEYMQRTAADVVSKPHFPDKYYWQDKGQDIYYQFTFIRKVSTLWLQVFNR